jgi:riboflavin biosynthesis pyrimidine reductase
MSTPWLRINLVTDIGGNTSGSDGTSDSIATRTDRKILGVIRALADVVLVGAQTVRTEGIGVPRTARIAVLTATGDLTGHGFAPRDLGRVIVLCPARAVERVQAQLDVDVVALPEVHDTVSLSAAVAALHSRGLNSIVCEGGPSLANGLLAAGLVDELCLTTVPRLSIISVRPASLVEAVGDGTAVLHQLLVSEDDTLFARWLIERH